MKFLGYSCFYKVNISVSIVRFPLLRFQSSKGSRHYYEWGCQGEEAVFVGDISYAGRNGLYVKGSGHGS